MSEFYKELKSIREDQGIDLEEIHIRTKINLNYLRAIEDGKFDLLPHTYVRLFIRAYAKEIGTDPDEIVSNLEEFLGNKTEKINRKKKDQLPKEGPAKLTVEDNGNVHSRRGTPQFIRSQTIKGIILVLILLFAIYIINIINEEKSVNTPVEYPIDFFNEKSISEQELQNNFDVLTESVQMYEADSPFDLKLATAELMWYRSKIDTFISMEKVLPPGDNRLYDFSQTIDILFQHTIGLNLYLNGSKLSSLIPSSNPVRISLSAIDKTVTIQHFIPKS